MTLEAHNSLYDVLKVSDSSKTSIIIPTHNYGQYLSWAIMSALHQTRPPKEIIVIDDSSTDNTKFIAQSFKDLIQYYYVDFKCAQKTRNFGLSITNGEYILFLDADDFLDNYALELLEKELDADKELKLAYSGRFHFGSSKIINNLGFKGSWISEPFDLEKLRQSNYIPMPSLIRKSSALKFDPNINRFQDWDAWLTLLTSNTDAKCVPYPLHHSRFHGNNKTLKIEHHTERLKVLLKHKLLRKSREPTTDSLSNTADTRNPQTSPKIFIIALNIDLGSSSSLIKCIKNNIHEIEGVFIQSINPQATKTMQSSLKGYIRHLKIGSELTTDQAINLSIKDPAYDKSDWIVISHFAKEFSLIGLTEPPQKIEATIYSPTTLDWTLGFGQESYIALNQKASQLVFPMLNKAENTSSRQIKLIKFISNIWDKHIGWRFQKN